MLLLNSSEALRFFQSACLTIVFHWASSKQFRFLPAVFTVHVLLRRESTSESDKFQGPPGVSLVYFLPFLSFPTGWSVLFPLKTFYWCFPCKHVCLKELFSEMESFNFTGNCYITACRYLHVFERWSPSVICQRHPLQFLETGCHIVLELSI